MGRYLELAEQSLQRRTEYQALTEAEEKVASPTHCEKSARSEISSDVISVDKWAERLRGSTDELQREAERDWDEVSNDPAQLVAFADSLAIVQIRESGGVPDSYVTVTTCRNCGEVPIWQGCPPQVNGCPWCLNRIKGLPLPNTGEIK